MRVYDVRALYAIDITREVSNVGHDISHHTGPVNPNPNLQRIYRDGRCCGVWVHEFVNSSLLLVIHEFAEVVVGEEATAVVVVGGRGDGGRNILESGWKSERKSGEEEEGSLELGMKKMGLRRKRRRRRRLVVVEAVVNGFIWGGKSVSSHDLTGGHTTAIGLIPLGTESDFARTLGWSVKASPAGFL
ncbi:unnamed protein product [Fraxinus pennsylvanica]|uniref:DAGKc domain-containing protein n=1 Tax=Fraxinus pennsylvanica TaxID=56036 RepID=A0AAD2A4X2_9LAMI|nr:unnamed protein product [Fraxinus pennsylvanica]